MLVLPKVTWWNGTENELESVGIHLNEQDVNVIPGRCRLGSLVECSQLVKAEAGTE